MPETTAGAVAKRLIKIREEGGAVALGRVLTLVIVADESDVEESVDAANDASREHPCRILVIAPAKGSVTNRLDAEIRVGGDAGASEVIVLRPSPVLAEHPDTLIMALLLPDAPIVAWWPSEFPASPSTDLIGQMAKIRITDSMRCADPLEALKTLRSNHRPGDIDLAWTRVTVWRGLLAAALDQPPYESVTEAVVAGDLAHPSVDLLAAWIAQRLKCTVSIERNHAANAITKVVLRRKSGDIALVRPDGRIATLSQPGQPDHRIALPVRELRECLSEELRRLDPDEVYGEVLAKGLARVEASQ
ncbi:glucose-6-phosphate dehydrogenase assembly protein OpcA [Sanguibacter gelidistatuariae]|uniref:Glucose-6-phosphate dehydrogenase assembly protein OpcA n=2 Tax=Sanguibacter gelidistatuariae TaxID=1814289 RepID=A0A1G6T6T7_9MICO|nr:glucose-6-phosphate dehydrogenase assembly protein OpcA [Sanguibacter gelidistatuariae]